MIDGSSNDTFYTTTQCRGIIAARWEKSENKLVIIESATDTPEPLSGLSEMVSQGHVFSWCIVSYYLSLFVLPFAFETTDIFTQRCKSIGRLAPQSFACHHSSWPFAKESCDPRWLF